METSIKTTICGKIQQKFQLTDYIKRRKSRKKRIYNWRYLKSEMNIIFILYINKKFNKLLLATLLLITMTPTTLICQTEAASVTALTSNVSRCSAASTLLELSPDQLARQQPVHTGLLQKQQLFAMLTRNRRNIIEGVSDTNLETNVPQILKKNLHKRLNVAVKTDENDIEQIHPRTASLEITGFISDDGQQYEKAERALAAAAAMSNSNMSRQFAKNCPIECKCLNDYIDCGKRHLDKLPAIPDFVQILDFVGNKFNDTTVLQIKNFPELNKLSLKRNQLENIPKFTGLLNLKQLNLANNRIQVINSEAITLLPKLKALDLSRNYLHTLQSKFFPVGNKLAHLIFNSNEISNIDENCFETLDNLLDLELNNNYLTTLPAGVFKNLSKLRKLSLNNNHLEINWSTFKGLISLQKLFLKSNYIRTLQDGVFHVMRAIETIELDHNTITSIGRQGLFNLTKLHHLSLSNNSIHRIDADTWEFTQSLISLDLSHNNISEIKPQHLDCLQRLKHLNLGHNKIQYLMDNTFDCVKNLEDLNLRRNKLSWIIEDQSATPPFKSLRKLKKLDLYGNNLKQINTKSLSGLNNLELLNLGGNSLATIQSGAFEQIPHLQKVIFKSLNFICDCALLWFRNWLQRNVQNNAQMRSNAVCGYPEYLLDRELLSLSPSELVCADTPKPVITQEPSNQLAVKGANITMECIGISPAAASLAAADELKIKWRHDNQNVREHIRSSNVDDTPHVFKTTETQIHHDQSTNQTTIIGYLRLYNVSYETAGKYQCVVSNAFGTTYSQKFKISIGIHPSFLQIPSNLTIDSGDSARLVCSATGDPMPEIALQKFGGSDFPAATERRLQVIREENAFIITNAKSIDTGIYTCTAESAAGEIKVNASLVVNDKPQAPTPLLSKEIVLGKSSVLECLTEAVSDMHLPHREWYKDNKPFYTSYTSNSKRYYFTPEKELLIIVNTQSIDSGHYRCEITDSTKTYAMQTELIVVKENFSQNVIIVGVILLTLACIFVCSLCVWVILLYQKHKLRLSVVHRPRGDSNTVDCNSAGFGAAQQLLSGGHGNILDHTQLTTVNSTFLQQKQQNRQRPRSFADFDTSTVEQCNYPIAGTTPNFEQLLNRKIVGNGEANNEEGITLEYLRRNSGHDAEHNHDHLSSKDSGTGSDAAVKRSIDDFTLTILPGTSGNNHQSNTSTLNKRHIIIFTGVDNDDDDGPDFATSPVLGVSDYELEMYDMKNFSNDDKSEVTENLPFLKNINQKLDLNTSTDNKIKHSCDANQTVNKCKEKISTNFNANSVATNAQAIDI